MSFFGFWRRLVPGPAEPGFAAGEKRQRLLYFSLAAALAVLVLGWAGNVHMLGALGFTQVNPLIDVLFTGLLLVGGAERTEALLGAMGASTGGEGKASSATPVEINGRVVLEDYQARAESAAAAHSPRS